VHEEFDTRTGRSRSVALKEREGAKKKIDSELGVFAPWRGKFLVAIVFDS